VEGFRNVALIVQKYGGTSVGDVERIQKVASRCIATQRAGNDVVVVVSAMSGETNRLLKLVSLISPRPSEREQDVVVATGEQVTIGLVALAIQSQNAKATSFLAHQCRIVTDSTFAKARIKSIDGEKIFEVLKKKHIAVVAGFQGIDDHGNITTLGRGGSDTTAVAIASAIKADACEIYTDVDGVYTSDPNICPAAKKLQKISYEEMLELSSLGAKVLQIRSVEFAMKYRVPLWVKSSFSDDPGTLVCPEDASMEDVVVAGIAYDKNEAKIAIRGVPDIPGIAAQIFGALDEKNIVVDLIVQNVAKEGRTDLTFTVGKTDLSKAKDVVKKMALAIKADAVETDDQISKVSIVGVGMRNHSGVAAQMFKVLAKEGINIQMISTSEIRVSCVIHEKYTELAVRTLHTAFGLDRQDPATAAAS
jgi:aspartate kinase